MMAFSKITSFGSVLTLLALFMAPTLVAGIPVDSNVDIRPNCSRTVSCIPQHAAPTHSRRDEDDSAWQDKPYIPQNGARDEDGGPGYWSTTSHHSIPIANPTVALDKRDPEVTNIGPVKEDINATPTPPQSKRDPKVTNIGPVKKDVIPTTCSTILFVPATFTQGPVKTTWTATTTITSTVKCNGCDLEVRSHGGIGPVVRFTTTTTAVGPSTTTAYVCKKTW